MKICKYCKKEFNKHPYDSKKTWLKKMFCSLKCANTFNNTAQKLIGTKRPKKVLEKMEPTMFKKGMIPWNKGKTFDAIKGEKHYFWKGGISVSPYYIAHRNKKRRALRFGNGGSHSINDWETLKAQYNWTCLMCKKQEPKIKLTEDHIIPLSKGGSDNIENIQPLCQSCNSKKRVQVINFRIVEK